MNCLGLLTLALGVFLYGFGLRWARIPMSRAAARWTVASTLLLATPGFFYAFYYSRLLGEPIWLYQVRSIPGSELLAAPSGFLAAWMQVRRIPRLNLSTGGRRFLIPVAFCFALAVPYLKPLLRPLDLKELQHHWVGGVCHQSTVSTCGPASAATVIRHLGGDVTECELATEAFTSRSGTENWYLVRALRRRGYDCDFVLRTPMDVSLPAIAGVRLKNLGGSGHFIALLARQHDRLVAADPMIGLATNGLVELQDAYEFTGFFLQIRRAGTR
jgi:hypothetical protein